ncbi:riboflavin synthase [Alicyclobacillus sp. SP_1]|jgi:riboflavin synthase|uniref:riboflavin synthase n=1 Tax=Alicyclobacillus sp. SP_1 TaxID=2942475 RepID=UPI00215784E4|nr:riboflavin synthase [Alicyclobacillus sp. SP_1]
MFTGLVEELARVEDIRTSAAGSTIQLAAAVVLADVHVGDSIAVNGVCLTVVRHDAHSFVVEAVPETMRRTTLGSLRRGDAVHVERAVAVGGRLGGHMVSGHVDGLGTVVFARQDGTAVVLSIAADESLLRYVVEKGSICVDGVSLTVMDVKDGQFQVSVIPHTGQVTLLGSATPGRQVNLECDVLAKYAEKWMRALATERPSGARSGVSRELLAEHGYLG